MIAGAGLAANLPGALSSKILLPVFGIPCAAAFGGVDALLSMLQMPFGIPVLVSAPNQFRDVADFILRRSKMSFRFTQSAICLVSNKKKREQTHYKLMWDRATRIADKAGITLEEFEEPQEEKINICLVDIQNTQSPTNDFVQKLKIGLGNKLEVLVPTFSDELYKEASSVQILIQQMQSTPGGLWVSANGIGNALLSSLLLTNIDGRYNAFLTSAKKGYIHV